MARLRLTIHKVNCYQDSTSQKLVEKTLHVSNEKETDTIFVKVSDTEYLDYTLNLVDLSFKKKMYQPTEVIAEIQLTRTNSTGWQTIDKKSLVELFLNKQVSLEEVVLDAQKKEDVVNHTIGSDFYVDEVKPCYRTDSLYVTLNIYSPDKLLTKKQFSRSFVAKKLLSDILTGELEVKETEKTLADGSKVKEKVCTYPLPYNKSQSITLDKSGAKQLFYKSDDKDKEHIFPYLVQYNESFYDFLARTTNRWGEFMYYENGKLNVGYNATAKEKEVGSNYNNITYVNLDNESKDVDGKYDYAGSEESKFINDTLRKSPVSVSGTLFWPTVKKWDKVLMKEITSFLKNDKNVPTWLGNRVFDNTWDAAVKLAAMSSGNRDFNGKYFPESNKPGIDEQYGEHNFAKEDEKEDLDDAFNQFSELDSAYKSSKYEGILKKEYLAAKDAVNIDYGTTCPNLNLGDIVKVNGEPFIVFEISSHIDEDTYYALNKNKDGVEKVTVEAQVFEVIATPRNSDDIFYPVVIPAGHVRMSDPQIAVITDAGDPSGNNRVRVMFDTWQTIHYEDEKKKIGITKDTKKLSSPWLTFAAGSAGSPTIGRHYEGDKVLVGFIDGNIERPYVIGGLNSKGEDADFFQTTPGGHTFKLSDDGDGIEHFLTGMFMPCVGTLSPFLSAIPFVKDIADFICKPAQGYKNNPAMGGGFELSDNYGIYKISGSTDGREVSIASPWGDVNINAFTGISISAPNGDISISGKNIKLEAGNNIEIISGTNIKNKILGEGGKSGFFGDVAAAVAKKLATKGLNVVDLSMIRSFLEIIFRPAEGQLRIKSNRYLMLDAGKGDCAYPENAFVDNDTYKGYLVERSKNYVRKGLVLSSGVVEMVSRVKTLGNLMDSRYRNSYNKCIDKLGTFKEMISAGERYAKGYNSITNQHPVFCNVYTDDALRSKLWADAANTNEIKAEDLGFKDNYKINDDNSVDESMARSVARSNGIDMLDLRYKMEDYKKMVFDKRKKHRDEIVEAANDLRNAIRDFLNFQALNADNDIKTTARTFKDRKMPKEFMTALVEAFDKTKLGDTYYFLPISDAQRKDLMNLAGQLDENATKTYRQILKRKAATLLLEGMGFKDDWRKKVVPAAPAPGAPVPPPPPTTAQVNDVGGAAVTVLLAPPPAPPAPELKVKRKFNSADLTDAYWTDYVDSLVAYPELKPDEFSLTKAVNKVLSDAKDKLTGKNFWELPSENKAWGDAKKGGILFSSDAKVYSLLQDIKEVPSYGREHLMEEEDNGADFTTFLTNVKEVLKKLED